MMQNQEFLELLKRDTDFMKTLERGMIGLSFKFNEFPSVIIKTQLTELIFYHVTERLNAAAFEPRSDSPELDPNRPPSRRLLYTFYRKTCYLTLES